MEFSDDELERYSRHILLREIGGAGQAKLKRARVLMLGAGGLGSPALAYLAAAGVGRLRVVDDDHVSLSNLQRQFLHATDRIGAPKTRSAGAALRAINPHVEIETRPVRLTAENAEELLAGCDLALDGSDNFDTRYLLNAACLAADVPLIAAAIGRWEGQIGLYRRGAPCYACVFPERPAPGLVPACAEAGVLGALAGVMGAMQAAEAVKALLGIGEGLAGRLMLHDALGAEWRSIRTRRDPACPVCAKFQPPHSLAFHSDAVSEKDPRPDQDSA